MQEAVVLRPEDHVGHHDPQDKREDQALEGFLEGFGASRKGDVIPLGEDLLRRCFDEAHNIGLGFARTDIGENVDGTLAVITGDGHVRRLLGDVNDAGEGDHLAVNVSHLDAADIAGRAVVPVQELDAHVVAPARLAGVLRNAEAPHCGADGVGDVRDGDAAVPGLLPVRGHPDLRHAEQIIGVDIGDQARFFQPLHHLLAIPSELVPVWSLHGKLYRKTPFCREAALGGVHHDGGGDSRYLFYLFPDEAHEFLLCGAFCKGGDNGAVPVVLQGDEDRALVHQPTLEAADVAEAFLNLGPLLQQGLYFFDDRIGESEGGAEGSPDVGHEYALVLGGHEFLAHARKKQKGC